MGCDGGTIPTRDEMVKMKKKPTKLDPQFNMHAKWKYCALSSEELKKPVVIDELGRLYNKEAIIKYLLDKAEMSEEVLQRVKHIRSLKDVKVATLTPNSDKTDNNTSAAKYVCPVIHVEMNGTYRFILHWNCGCVISERAFTEIKSDNCHNCGAPVKKEDVIILNPKAEELTELKQRMKTLRLKAKEAKKAAKAAKAAKGTKGEEGKPKVKRKADNGKGPVTHSKKTMKISSAYISSEVKDALKYKDVQDKEGASAAYKSLFTSANPDKASGSFTSRTTYATYF